MITFHASLFGRVSFLAGDHPVTGLQGAKSLELLGYLLLYRDRPHLRESLADLLWPESPPDKCRAYLRKVLWQLQNALPSGHDEEILTVDAEWVQLNATLIDLDVADFEASYHRVRKAPAPVPSAELARDMRLAIGLYRGDLLEGWFQDWCLFERERLLHIRMILLDRLMDYSESVGEYETGLMYGAMILRNDLARECTHRKMMRLHHLAGDRTGALRQYERCREALQSEFGVAPGELTESLHQQMRADCLPLPG